MEEKDLSHGHDGNQDSIDYLEHLMLTQPSSQVLAQCLAFYENQGDWKEIVLTVEDWKDLFTNHLPDYYPLYQKALACSGKWTTLEEWLLSREDLTGDQRGQVLTSYRGDYLRYKALQGEKNQENLQRASDLLLAGSQIQSEQAAWIGLVLRSIPFVLTRPYIEFFLQHQGIPLYERGLMLAHWLDQSKEACTYLDWQGHLSLLIPENVQTLEEIPWIEQAQKQADQSLLWAKLLQDAVKLFPHTIQVIADLDSWLTYFSQLDQEGILGSLMADDQTFIREYKTFLGLK